MNIYVSYYIKLLQSYTQIIIDPTASCLIGARSDAILIGNFYFFTKPPHLLIDQTMYFTITSVPRKFLELLVRNDVVRKKRRRFCNMFFLIFRFFFLMKNVINNGSMTGSRITKKKTRLGPIGYCRQIQRISTELDKNQCPFRSIDFLYPIHELTPKQLMFFSFVYNMVKSYPRSQIPSSMMYFHEFYFELPQLLFFLQLNRINT